MSSLAKQKSRLYYTFFIISIFLVVWFYTGDLISLIFPELSGYNRLSMVYGLEILLCIGAVMIITRRNPVGAVEELGLLKSLPTGLWVSIIITLPLPLIFSLSSPISNQIEGIRLLYFAFLSPLEEEIIFRGFAFWMLYKYAKLGFWGAVLAPSFLFGIVHLYQADAMMDAVGIFGITTVGGIWFSWLLMRWENLWVPIFIHALMNGWWQIFEVDDTALGGYLANIARLLVIAISILFTIKKEKLLTSMGKWFSFAKEGQPE